MKEAAIAGDISVPHRIAIKHSKIGHRELQDEQESKQGCDQGLDKLDVSKV